MSQTGVFDSSDSDPTASPHGDHLRSTFDRAAELQKGFDEAARRKSEPDSAKTDSGAE